MIKSIVKEKQISFKALEQKKFCKNDYMSGANFDIMMFVLKGYFRQE